MGAPGAYLLAHQLQTDFDLRQALRSFRSRQSSFLSSSSSFFLSPAKHGLPQFNLLD
jgi:hypothetical protein